MPFKEIKPLKDFIRIHKRGITISTSLLHYFMDNNNLQRIKIFIDEENSLIGLQKSEEGYKLSEKGGAYVITCSELSKKFEEGLFFPKWDNKEKMLIFKY